MVTPPMRVGDGTEEPPQKPQYEGGTSELLDQPRRGVGQDPVANGRKVANHHVLEPLRGRSTRSHDGPVDADVPQHPCKRDCRRGCAERGGRPDGGAPSARVHQQQHRDGAGRNERQTRVAKEESDPDQDRGSKQRGVRGTTNPRPLEREDERQADHDEERLAVDHAGHGQERQTNRQNQGAEDHQSLGPHVPFQQRESEEHRDRKAQRVERSNSLFTTDTHPLPNGGNHRQAGREDRQRVAGVHPQAAACRQVVARSQVGCGIGSEACPVRRRDQGQDRCKGG